MSDGGLFLYEGACQEDRIDRVASRAVLVGFFCTYTFVWRGIIALSLHAGEFFVFHMGRNGKMERHWIGCMIERIGLPGMG